MSTPTSPPATGAPGSTFTPPPPPPKGRISKGTGVAIAAVVVIILVILALLLTGVIPGLKSSGSSPGPSAPTYNVTFSETGLPTGTSWSVTLAGSTQSSTTSSIVFSEKNGSYPFTLGTVSGYSAHPASGTATVSGAAVTESIAFTTGYSVTFTESGLPSGTSWSVTLNGTALSSTTASIVFTESNGTLAYTVATVSGYVATPSSGSVTVSGAGQSVSVSFSPIPPNQYPVRFTETGLPAGTSWSVTLNGTLQSSSTPTISFNEPNGTISYTVGAVSGYTASPSSGHVTVSGSASAVSIAFTASVGLTGPEYPITWDQTGLPATDLWSVGGIISVGGSTYYFGAKNAGPSTEFSIPDGTYTWVVTTSVSGYVAVPSFGNLTVSGAPVTISITFEALYNVTFTETGVSSSATWQVDLNHTVNSEYGGFNNTFQVPNGTYGFTASAFGYSASPATGSVTVNGAPVTQAVAFTAMTTYTVTFSESGLASGSVWSVDLNGTTQSTVAPLSIVFTGFPNGIYLFTVSTLGYYTASPSNGTLTVASAPVAKSITFSSVPTYSVTFTETGLPSGASWYADLNDSTGSATAPASISLSVPAGLNYFTVVTTASFTPKPASGTVTVTTSGATVSITFLPLAATYTVTFTETGLPAFTPFWEVDAFNDGPFISSAYLAVNSTFSATSLNLSLPNGNYTWIAYSYVANFTASPMAGYFMVSGHALSVSVTYVNSSGEYLAWFGEEWYQISGHGGLPNGTSWSVTIGGQTQTTQGADLFFLLPNGTTEAYSIAPPTGYLALPGYGNLTGYASPTQSLEYFSTSPAVALVFVVDPPSSAAAPTAGGPSASMLLSSAMAAPGRRA